MNNITQRRILGNLRQLVGRVDLNRAAKSTRLKVLPLGLRPASSSCRCIPEVNKEVEKVLEKNEEKPFLRLVYLRRKENNLPTKCKKKNELYAWLQLWNAILIISEFSAPTIEFLAV